MRRGGRPGASASGGQRQFPILSDQVAAEAVMWFFADQTKAGSLIDTASGHQHVICPQCNLAIAGPSGEADTLGDQPGPDAEPAGFRLDVKQAQLSDFVAILDEQYRTDN